MCCCGKPSVNGESNAYSWDGKTRSTYRPNPPELREGEVLIYDLPGRCGGVDSHSHHLRLVSLGNTGRSFTLMVRHGGGDVRLPLGFTYRVKALLAALEPLDDNGRYWVLLALLNIAEDAAQVARDANEATWRQAAADKRIKTRKMPGKNKVKVWVEPKNISIAKEPVT